MSLVADVTGPSPNEGEVVGYTPCTGVCVARDGGGGEEGEFDDGDECGTGTRTGAMCGQDAIMEPVGERERVPSPGLMFTFHRLSMEWSFGRRVSGCHCNQPFRLPCLHCMMTMRRGRMCGLIQRARCTSVSSFSSSFLHLWVCSLL